MPLDLFAEEEEPLDLFAEEIPARPTLEARQLTELVKPQREPLLSPEFKKGFVETTKAFGRLAKQPMGIIEGAIQFATSLPGFGVGVVKGTQNMLTQLQSPTNMSDLYDAFMGGLEEGAEALEPAVYKPHIPEAELVGATAMAPWTGTQMALNKIADDPIYDNYPNLKGYLKFAGFVGGAKLMKKMYHPNLTKGIEKNITDISDQAMKMREAYELVKEMPESPLKTLRIKELEIRERKLHERLAVIENKIQRPKTPEELGVRVREREVPELTKRLEGHVPYKAKIGAKPELPAAEKGLAKDIGKVYQAEPKGVGEPVIYDKVKGKTIRRPPFFEFERGKEPTAEQKLRAKLKETRKEKAEIKKEPIDLFKEEKPIATFRGWQETAKGDHLALYNVGKDTWSAKTLKEKGIAIPKTPEKPALKPKIAPTIEAKAKGIGEVAPEVKAPASLAEAVSEAGGISDKTLPGELRDLTSGWYAKGGAKKFKKVPAISKEGGYPFDDMRKQMEEQGYKYPSEDTFRNRLGEDLAAIAEGKPENRVRSIQSLFANEEKMWDTHIKEETNRGINEREARKSISLEVIRKTKEKDKFNKLADEIFEEEYNKLSEEIKPTQATLIKGEPKFELKGEEAPPKRLGPQGKKAVFPTEKIKAGTKGKTKTFLPPKAGDQITLETFGFQTAYEKATEWTKAIKEGRETKVREAVDSMRDDYLKPVEGNPLDRSAINYLKSEKYSDYLKGMPSIGELKPNEIYRLDPTSGEYIAAYKTKDGKIKPAIRQSGYHVLPEFADAFDKSMDVGKLTGAWTDPTRMLEQLDQGKWAGMAQKHILWPTRMTTQAKLRWADNHKADLSKIFEDHKITSGRKRKAEGDILEYIDNKRLNVPAKELLKVPEIEKALKGYKDRTQITMIEGAKSLRKLLNKLLDEENQARGLRGQKKIPYRKFYRTWIMEANLWAKLSGQKMKPKEIMESPEMPDFIKPNNAFISHAERRAGLLAKYPKERDIGVLLSDYIETAAKDIFDTNIVHNNKIHTAVLRGKGLENAADAIDTWTAEAYAGVSPRLTRWAKETIPPSIRGGALKVRRNLTRAVFPLNWSWSAFIQTCSSGITYARYGNKATLAGLEYFTSPTLRRAIKQNAYSSIIKSRWGGRTHYQDIQNSILKNKRLDAKPIEKAEDFANFLTSSMEDALTGHAVAAAYYDGKTRLHLKGRELWEYASEGGAKTQSMYNYQDLPGLLRAREAGAAAPFQTYAFEAFNTVREMNLPVVRRVIGKTGLYETMTADSVAGKALLSKRLMMIGRWTAAIVVTNAVVEKAIGRKPWVLSSFLPFIGYILGGKMITGYPGRGPDFTPKKYIDDFRKGVKDVLVSENFGKLRKWILRYHILAGIQMERTISGIEAISKEGRVKDVRGRLMYRVKPEDYLKALTMGPSRTEAARKYYEKKEEGSSLLEKLRKKLKSSKIKAVAG